MFACNYENLCCIVSYRCISPSREECINIILVATYQQILEYKIQIIIGKIQTPIKAGLFLIISNEGRNIKYSRYYIIIKICCVASASAAFYFYFNVLRKLYRKLRPQFMTQNRSYSF